MVQPYEVWVGKTTVPNMPNNVYMKINLETITISSITVKIYEQWKYT